MSRGPFIALEGIDGAGKTTQRRMLAEWLRGRGFAVAVCTDPGGTPLGDQIRGILLEGRREISLTAEMLLFMASRAELVERVIRPALANGSAVVSDRYLLSNIAYQGYAGGLDPNEVRRLGRFAVGGLEPDLSIALDLTPEQGALRRDRREDRVERRGPAYQEAVRQGFLSEARLRPESIRVVDAAQSVEAVHAAVVREVASVLERAARA
jgi:dTMP kinase